MDKKENHKILLEKYGLIYTNEYGFLNIKRAANKLGLSLEEYLEIKQNESNLNIKEVNLLLNNNFENCDIIEEKENKYGIFYKNIKYNKVSLDVLLCQNCNNWFIQNDRRPINNFENLKRITCSNSCHIALKNKENNYKCKICNNYFHKNNIDKIEICKDCRKISLEEIEKFLLNNDFTNFKIIDEKMNKNNIEFKRFEYKFIEYYIYKCSECQKWFLRFRDNSQTLENFENISKIYCSRNCQVKSQHKLGQFVYRCKKCNNKLISSFSKCDKCGYYESYINGIASPEWRIFDKNINCNSNCNFINDCSHKNDLKNYYGFCKFKVNNTGVISNQWNNFSLNIPCNKQCKNYNNCLHTSNLKNCWGWCKESPNLHGNFNRDKFYENKLNIISFDSLDQEVSLQDCDNLKGKLGVWSRWTDKNHGNYCLDVCKTIDIGGEMLSSLRSFNSLKENPDQELDIGWKKKYYNQAKDSGILDNSGKIIFKLVALCSSQKEALNIEAQYAHDNKAKYWSPEPGQNIIDEYYDI